MTEDRDRRARIRSADTILKRISNATAAIGGAMMQEALETDQFGHDIASIKYKEAEEELDIALNLIADCRRSIDA
jgi:hypothetical protein